MSDIGRFCDTIADDFDGVMNPYDRECRLRVVFDVLLGCGQGSVPLSSTEPWSQGAVRNSRVGGENRVDRQR